MYLFHSEWSTLPRIPYSDGNLNPVRPVPGKGPVSFSRPFVVDTSFLVPWFPTLSMVPFSSTFQNYPRRTPSV